MSTFQWTELRGPGEVTWARATPDGAVTVVRTMGGDLYLGRPAGTGGWTWQRTGIPPGGPVRDAVPLGVDASGAATMAVTDVHAQAWLYDSGAPQPWTSLGTPPADPALPQSGNGGLIAASTASAGASPQPTLIVTDAAQQPWIRQGTDSGGTWSPMTLGGGLTVWGLATVLASVAPGADPQLHVIAVVRGPDGQDALQVAVTENASWTWHDTGGLDPDHPSIAEISATSVADGSGRLLAAVLARVSGSNQVLFTVNLVTGSGSNWSMIGLGRPTASSPIAKSVIAVKGPGPRAGAEPVAVAAVGDHIWTRSPSTNWTDRGTNPGGAGTASPFTVLDRDDMSAGLWAVGTSDTGDLWTFTLDADVMSWQQHGIPEALTKLVGSYNDLHGIGDLAGTKAFVIDTNGALWHARLKPPPGESWWVYHGQPPGDVECTAPVGVFRVSGGMLPPDASWQGSSGGAGWAFTAGSDGHLWARSADVSGWTWVDHGMPGGRAVKSGTSPVASASPANGVAVHVLADDGRLWMRAGATGGPNPGPGWTWIDRGVPSGQLIFAIIGAVAMPGSSVVAVITGDGAGKIGVWASTPAGAGFTWTDLKAPDEGIFAGVGLEVPAWDQTSVDVSGLGQSSQQVWTARWKPGAAAPQWSLRGSPAGAPVRAGIGTAPDAGAGGTLVTVLGNDGQLWTVSTSSATPAWSRRDPPVNSATTSVTSGCLAELLDRFLSYAIVLNQSKRLAVNGQPFP